MPEQVVSGLVLEKITRLQQPRRSKVHSEVLVRMSSHNSRDVVQSYAANLASANGNAGLRLEVPEHLLSLFRRFESHAANLREAYGQIKRSIRFDDTNRSLCMDVKLPSTGWHRIDKDCMAQIVRSRNSQSGVQGTQGGKAREEMRKILLIDPPPSGSNGPGDGSQADDEEVYTRRSARSSGKGRE